MFESIKLKFSETGELSLPTKGITIFVGANNSGKSLVLREIEAAFATHPFPAGLKILMDYEVVWPTSENLDARIAKAKSLQQPGLPLGHIVLGRHSPGGGLEAQQVPEAQLRSIADSKADKHWITTQYLRWGVIRLDGRSRFVLTNDQKGGDLLGPPQNVLAHLFLDTEARKSVRALIKDAFNLYLVIDPTNLGQLRIRLSQEPPLDDEQSLNPQAREYHGRALHIKDASDGVQAFTGIVTAVRSGEFHTILVDEPEAFLHPPLARKLGRNLAALTTERGAALLASTHSSDFLMGCIQASTSVRVVRLEYSGGKSRARMIDPDVLATLLKRPLMRSANVISGLFHDGVVVLESDNDRAFYSEIYHRITEAVSGYPSILFINAQNKQTIRDIIGPLRQFGVPAAAIPDIDFLKDGGKTWTDWLRAAQVPEALHVGYGQQRAAIHDAIKATGRDMKTEGGLDLLDRGNREAADQFVRNLRDYGIFPVPRGELESWLPELAIPGKKTDWTVSILERLGSDPSSPDYTKPAEEDVWLFMRDIASWIGNSARKGTA
ncbi:ATP-dependent endonuclease [Rhizobium johnstonii]|uniref:ATP-dependent nuclease n=1 Tax=Rhizobium johnstonii TaxID=3019933 RepID=UPI003F98C203